MPYIKNLQNLTLTLNIPITGKRLILLPGEVSGYVSDEESLSTEVQRAIKKRSLTILADNQVNPTCMPFIYKGTAEDTDDYPANPKKGWLVASIGDTTTPDGLSLSDGALALFDGDNWVLASCSGCSSKFTKEYSEVSVPEAHYWGEIAYGSGRYVAVGDNSLGSRVITSLNGYTWDSVSGVPNRDWIPLKYGKGRFVALSPHSTYSMVSFDGLSWNEYSNLPNKWWVGLACGNDLFVTIAYEQAYNPFYVSSDGATWNPVTRPSSDRPHGICYGNGRFVVVSQFGSASSQVIVSDDGYNWQSRSSSSAARWLSVCHGNNRFVATGEGNSIMYSDDGDTWTASPAISGATNDWHYVAYGSGLFVAVSYNGNTPKAIYSEDGINWASGDIVPDGTWYQVYVANCLVIINGDGDKFLVSPPEA